MQCAFLGPTATRGCYCFGKLCVCLLFYQLPFRGFPSQYGRKMISDSSSTMWLLQCLAGMHNNLSSFDAADDRLAGFAGNTSSVNHNESYPGIRRHPSLAASNGTGVTADDWNAGSWLRDGIKSRMVPTICAVGILLRGRDPRESSDADRARLPTTARRSHGREEGDRLASGAGRLRPPALCLPSPSWPDGVRRSPGLPRYVVPAAVQSVRHGGDQQLHTIWPRSLSINSKKVGKPYKAADARHVDFSKFGREEVPLWW